mmetsp:Transcript_43078/g.91828  ORF Transcript_43078/g.91828 Transcript_43078/m.91828 type:complete len:171 (-) Transcript_43078:33-545(-)|eukprot:CAMPEP_0183352966 /NCGR_PEP_ID=MMETSP0164_2-20130417/31818_1 /TAXON_ID=221442 /ORGANISM="Coccolithus pelagicus ssp braarudi, Strain PLY182g" /LENGTH=170 /DNA_ID=CAMNT_0025525543 /DNA_START=39 /DNA_END=551 /DNA_ORIENTATION=+
MSRRLLLLVSTLYACGAAEQSVEDLLAGMKGMPGMENIKMFSADDLKNMDPNKMGDMFGGGGGRGSKRSKKTRSQNRRKLVEFYEKYGLDDKVAGADAALDKWKGREEKMFEALNKKYKDVIDKYWEKHWAEVDAEREAKASQEEAMKEAEDAVKAEEDALNNAFGKTEL